MLHVSEPAIDADDERCRRTSIMFGIPGAIVITCLALYFAANGGDLGTTHRTPEASAFAAEGSKQAISQTVSDDQRSHSTRGLQRAASDAP